MYKVFLVEDEIVVREGIRNSIPWDTTPYSLAGEAPDGEMALPMIQDIKPDILITDIRMPFMDGLALSRIVKRTMPWIKIIILSGHDEFEYAREAISAGVEEYLLKPVSARDMLKTLAKTAAHIDEEKEKMLDIEKLKAKARSQADILRDKWLSDFFSGRIPPARAIEKGREFGVDLLGRSYIVLAIGLTGEEDREEQLVSAKIILQNIMEQYANGIWFCENEKHFVILLREMSHNVKGNNSETNNPGEAGTVEETAYTIAQAFKHEIERNTGYKAAVGVGPLAERIGEAVQSCSQARKIADYCIARNLPQIADSGIFSGKDDGFDPQALRNIDGDMFLTKLKYAAVKDIDSILRDYTKGLDDNFTGNQMFVFFMLGEIIVAASKITEALGGDLRKIAPFPLNREDIHRIAGSRDVFFEKVRALLAAVIEYRDAHSRGRYQSVIVKAREYIDRNFASADLSLYSAAAHVGISPNHLSTVFAQETGENFIEYLTRVRLEKAKQLLRDTAMKSADISGETGFSDPHYFSYIFKKHTGLSPREFRNTATNEGF